MRIRALVCVSLLLVPFASRSHGQANVHLDVSVGLINKVAQQDIVRCDPVNEEVKDIPVRGLAVTVAKAQIELVPNAHCAGFDIMTRGQAHTRVYADAYSVYAHAASLSPFEIRKRVLLTPGGLFTYEATSSVMTATRLLGFSSEFNDAVPEHIRETAVQLFNEDRQVDDTLGSFRAMLKINKQTDEESLPRLREADKQYRDGLAKLKDYGIGLEGLHFSTTRKVFSAAVRLAADGPSGTAPAVPGQDFDVAVRVHQAPLNRMAQLALAGKEFSDKDLKARLNEVLAQVGIKQRLQPAPLDVTFRFAAKEPVLLAFAENALIATVHIEKIKLPGGDFSDVKFRIRFKLERIAGGIALVRQRVELLAPTGNFLQDELIRVGLETMLLNRVELGRFTVPANVGTLEISDARTAHGWLLAAFKSRN